MYENKLYYPLRARDIWMFVSLPLGGALCLNGSCTSIFPHPSWRRPARLQLQHHGRDRGGSDCQPLGTSAGLGFPSTRHLNWAAGHQLLLHSPPCCDRKPPVSPPARQGCSYFLDTNTTEFWSVWGGPARFWEQDSGSRWTITAVALLTAARCIIFWGIPLLAPGRNWIAVTWCCACERHDLGFCLFSRAVFVYWEILVNNNKVIECGGFRPSSTSGLELGGSMDWMMRVHLKGHVYGKFR